MMMMMMMINLIEHLCRSVIATKCQKLTSDVGGWWSNRNVVHHSQCGDKTLRHVGDLVAVLTDLRHELGRRRSIGHKRWTDTFQWRQPVVKLRHVLVHLAYCHL